MRATVNIIGPDGELVLAGAEVPTDWPQEFLDSLAASGGTEPDAEAVPEPVGTVAFNADTQLPQPAPEPLAPPEEGAEEVVTEPDVVEEPEPVVEPRGKRRKGGG